MAKTAVVILNWNGKDFLQKFLPSVIQYSLGYADIIVADNASTDGSVDFLRNSFPEVSIIRNQVNGGFAKGYNDALVEVDAEYFILLNSDIKVSENWIQPIISLMENDPQIAACQPLIRSFHHPEKFEYAGAAGGFIDAFGYPFCRGRIFQHLEDDHGQYDDPIEVFWATGACMFVRADIFREFGGFDADFFAHMEEIDFCWRVKHAGYKIMVCPESKVFHVGGGTLPKRSSFKTYLNMRNNIALLYKNLPSDKLLKVFIIRLILDGVAAFKFLVDGGFADFWAVVRAHMSFYRNFNKHRKKRHNIIHHKVSQIYLGNIVVDHFLKRKNKYTDLHPNKFSR
ncbi:MAG: glycosyltransferase family 2 protein [Bacteroidales bacterium]|nr:glycosyltransferase family 2 protein [Bacteroidales bacterium]